jgi:hypothetical protein
MGVLPKFGSTEKKALDRREAPTMSNTFGDLDVAATLESRAPRFGQQAFMKALFAKRSHPGFWDKFQTRRRLRMERVNLDNAKRSHLGWTRKRENVKTRWEGKKTERVGVFTRATHDLPGTKLGRRTTPPYREREGLIRASSRACCPNLGTWK